MGNELDKLVSAYDSRFPYALDNELILNWYADRIIQHNPTGSLLELGIGHGYTTRKFSAFFQRHIVIEGSSEIISSYAAHGAGNTEIIHSYFENFDSSDRFDNIIMGFILEHVDDPEFILKKFRQYLAPNGKVFVAVPNAEALNRRYGLESGLIDDLKALAPADIALGHKRIFTLDSLKQLVDACGYTVTFTEGIFLKPVATHQLIALNLDRRMLEAMLKVGVPYPELSVAILMQLEVKEQ